MLRELLAVLALAAAALWILLERAYRDAFIDTARGVVRELMRLTGVERLPGWPDGALGPVVSYGPALVLIAIAAALVVSGWRRRRRLRAEAREELKRRSRS